MVEETLILENKVGLHARPAAEMVKLASRYGSRVMLYGKGKTANAKSIISVISLGLGKGDRLTISAEGPDEEECVCSLAELVRSGFHEV